MVISSHGRDMYICHVIAYVIYVLGMVAFALSAVVQFTPAIEWV